MDQTKVCPGSITPDDILNYNNAPKLEARRFSWLLTPSPPPPILRESAENTRGLLARRRRHRTMTTSMQLKTSFEEEESEFRTPMLTAAARSISSHELYEFASDSLDLPGNRPVSTLSSPASTGTLYPPEKYGWHRSGRKLSKSVSNISTSSNDSGYST